MPEVKRNSSSIPRFCGVAMATTRQLVSTRIGSTHQRSATARGISFNAAGSGDSVVMSM